MILYIDTSDNKKTIVVLGDNKKEIPSGKTKSQQTLPLIEKLLKETGTKLEDVSEIAINEGPGSFTGLRVGCAIANALGWALKKPVNGKKGEIVIPKYEV